MQPLKRVVLACLVAVCGLALCGAATPFIATPSVMVFPVQSSDGSMDRETAAHIATVLASHIAIGGHINVLPPPAGVDRKDYAEVAGRAGADYYVSGLVVALAAGVSMVLQVVSLRTGVVVYSTTSNVANIADVGAQGDILREGIAHYVDRYMAPYAALPTPGPAPSASPSPAAPTGRH